MRIVNSVEPYRISIEEIFFGYFVVWYAVTVLRNSWTNRYQNKINKKDHRRWMYGVANLCVCASIKILNLPKRAHSQAPHFTAKSVFIKWYIWTERDCVQFCETIQITRSLAHNSTISKTHNKQTIRALRWKYKTAFDTQVFACVLVSAISESN